MSPKHPLIEYAAQEGKSLEAIAKKAGCSRMTLYRLMAGKNATVDMLQKVSAATDGRVPVSAFLPPTSTNFFTPSNPLEKVG